jgi:hypothetical protein
MTDNRSRAQLLAALLPAQRAQIITSPEETAALEFDWSFSGRPRQHAPAGSWSNSPAKPPALPERIEAVLQLRE